MAPGMELGTPGLRFRSICCVRAVTVAGALAGLLCALGGCAQPHPALQHPASSAPVWAPRPVRVAHARAKARVNTVACPVVPGEDAGTAPGDKESLFRAFTAEEAARFPPKGPDLALAQCRPARP